MIVNKIIYFCFIVGILFVESPMITELFLGLKKNIRLKRHFDGGSGSENWGYEDKLTKHVFLLLRTTTEAETIKAVNLFYIISGLIMAGTFLILAMLLPMMTALIGGMMTGFMPYIILQAKLQIIRVNNSKEAEILVSELLNNYKICYYNMKEAIEVTANNITGAPHSKKLLFNLAKGLNKVADKEGVLDLLNVFRYSIDTSWGNVLATNIFFAQVLGIKITASLKDLVESISQSKNVAEYSRRENNEANLMLKYLAPICYILTVAGACKYFGFTLKKFILYQFGTPTGVTWFVIICGFYIAGIVINIFLSKGKMDI